MRVLIVKLSSMGDLVQALPALTDACAAHPDLVFDWAVDETFADIPLWHPGVRQVMRTAHRRWRKAPFNAMKREPGQIFAFLKQLRQTHYDYVIDAQTNLKGALVTRLARGPRHGPDKDSVREYPAHWAYQYHYAINPDQLAIDRWRQLFSQVLHYPLPATPPDFGLQQVSWPDVTTYLPQGPFIVAVPNASWKTKQWVDEHWRQLLQMASTRQLKVLLTSGSAAEREHCEQIVAGQPNAVVLPQLSISEVAALMRQSLGSICMDTGLAHVSAALDVPTVTLYGPTDPALIGATGSRSVHLVATGFDCIPCYHQTCEVAGYVGKEAQCLKRLQPARVWQAFTDLVGDGLPARPQ